MHTRVKKHDKGEHCLERALGQILALQATPTLPSIVGLVFRRKGLLMRGTSSAQTPYPSRQALYHKVGTHIIKVLTFILQKLSADLNGFVFRTLMIIAFNTVANPRITALLGYQKYRIIMDAHFFTLM